MTYAGANGPNFPIDIINGGTVTGGGLPAGTTVTSSGGSSTLTLSNPVASNATLEFFGVPAVYHDLGDALVAMRFRV